MSQVQEVGVALSFLRHSAEGLNLAYIDVAQRNGFVNQSIAVLTKIL
jgi:hypothetical protein